MASDASYSRIIDGRDTEPKVLNAALDLANKQSTLKKIPELRRRIVAALAHHYRLLQTQSLPDSSGVVARMIVHRHFAQLELHPYLWSLSRGLARREEEYHAALDMTDRTLEIELNGGVQPSSCRIA